MPVALPLIFCHNSADFELTGCAQRALQERPPPLQPETEDEGRCPCLGGRVPPGGCERFLPFRHVGQIETNPTEVSVVAKNRMLQPSSSKMRYIEVRCCSDQLSLPRVRVEWTWSIPRCWGGCEQAAGIHDSA